MLECIRHRAKSTEDKCKTLRRTEQPSDKQKPKGNTKDGKGKIRFQKKYFTLLLMG